MDSHILLLYGLIRPPLGSKVVIYNEDAWLSQTKTISQGWKSIKTETKNLLFFLIIPITYFK
ncbi:MAG: hypothetical protein CL678_10810 [Bdellovibrionaceae bacterium]|nr:hypothetical protein [Pseudobdellovibrionaceae bacterium]